MNKEEVEALTAQAKAALERGILVGHVMVTQVADDLHFCCTSCQAKEIVKNFYDGGRPQKFTYMPTMMDGREYVKCETCGKVHDRIVPGAN
jgi:ribosomal protein S26